MLKKLLKYDLRAIFRYWWIMAISSVGLSFIGGICLNTFIYSANSDPSAIVMLMAMLGLIATVVGLSAFFIVTEILIFVRFYKNFFTDEGYLTFTLPVKRSQLLNSKLIATMAATLATVLTIAADVLLLLAIGAPDFFNKEIWQAIGWYLREATQAMRAYFFIYAIEILLLTLCLAISSMLLIYICITLASIIAKKAKVITAIGIYYGAYTAVTFAVELIYVFGLMFLGSTLTGIPDAALMGIIALILLVILAFVVALCVILYLVEYYMLDKKLNLA